MKRTQHLAVFLALVIGAACTSGVQSQTANATAASACPINDFSKVDWTTAKDACATLDSPNFCNSCICGVGVALVVGLDAAGVKINGQPLSTLAVSNSSAVNDVLTQCQTTLGLQLLQSGTVTADAVTQLAKCDVQAAGNNCLGQVSSGAVGGLATPVVAPGNVPAQAAVLQAAQAARNGASVSSGVKTLLGLLAGAMAAVLLV